MKEKERNKDKELGKKEEDLGSLSANVVINGKALMFLNTIKIWNGFLTNNNVNSVSLKLNQKI